MASKVRKGRKAKRAIPVFPERSVQEDSPAYRVLRANRGRKARPVTLAQQDPPASQELMDNPVLRVMPELLVIRGLLANTGPMVRPVRKGR